MENVKKNINTSDVSYSLLKKYMARVDSCEGTDFTETLFINTEHNQRFTYEEVNLLLKISDENRNERIAEP